jgi:predicted metal-dependent phosphoesterase TrpH
VPDNLAAQRYAENPELISRAHFARYLVEAGRANDVKSVFQRYLVKDRPGYVPHQWAALEEAVGWIRDSGGVAVVAHPGRYKFAKAELREFFTAFRACGGAGIEVVTGSHTPQQYLEFARAAREFGFLASRGSDYHGKGESHADLGTLPLLPEDLKPVWRDW